MISKLIVVICSCSFLAFAASLPSLEAQQSSYSERPVAAGRPEAARDVVERSAGEDAPYQHLGGAAQREEVAAKLDQIYQKLREAAGELGDRHEARSFDRHGRFIGDDDAAGDRSSVQPLLTEASQLQPQQQRIEQLARLLTSARQPQASRTSQNGATSLDDVTSVALLLRGLARAAQLSGAEEQRSVRLIADLVEVLTWLSEKKE